MCMTDVGTTQDNFILPALPVEGLPISQDWLDRSSIQIVREETRCLNMGYSSDSQGGAYAPPVGPGENLVGWEIF